MEQDQKNPVSVEIKGKVAWITIDNPPVNATSTAVRAGLLEAVEAVQCSDLAVLQCAGKTFVAGGDMSEFDAPPAEPHLPDVVDAIENSPTPFVSMLHGNVLGGGFEIAMACAFRIAKPGTRFGLPEVHVGLIPGAGGTQRAPRLLGWEKAIDMACFGKSFLAEDLLAINAIDAISENPQSLIEEFIGKPAKKVPEKSIDLLGPGEIEAARSRVVKASKGQSAPLHNFEALLWAAESYQTGQPKERALHLSLRQSAESKALRHVFFAERTVTKPQAIKGGQPRDVNTIAIAGGGLMGSGIAVACLNNGYSVTIIERDDSAAKAANENVDKLLKGGVERGKVSQAQYEQRLAALKVSTSFSDAATADLAIEAIFEDLKAKQDVFMSLADAVSSDTVLATNTSYLDPRDVFAGIDNQDRCLGIHFFSPAHIMKLVEIVRMPETSSDMLATAFAFASSLRKIPVLSGICDGFIGNRILMAYRRAAEYLLADGALPQDVDKAMRDFGMAMGPFEAQDMAGLQIAQANRRRQDATRNPLERYVPISDRLCDLGRFGRRSGKGWYDYETGSKSQPDPVVEDLITAYAAEMGIKRQSFSPEHIQSQLLTAMANEGARIVGEGIAESDEVVDVVKVAGYGFPRWKGGPMHWAQSQPPGTLQENLKELAQASPNSWTPAERFKTDR